MKSLSSGDVHLYCKACSARLTKQPLRDVVEMPSLNWEDVADNWFGGCCTSFGGASEKLISHYINAYGRLQRTTLLDATSIIIEKDYLETDIVSRVDTSVPSVDFVALEEAMFNVTLESDHTAEKIKLNNSEEEVCHEKKIGSNHLRPPVLLEEGPCIDTEKNGGTPWTDQCGTIQLNNGGDVNSEKSTSDCFIENIEQTSQEVDLNLVDPCSCCGDGGDSGKAGLENQRDYKLTKSISLGSSFIVKEPNLVKDVNWVELLCSHCSSSLGSYPSQYSDAPSDGRVRLFKCYTSSDLPVGGPHDVFRGDTHWKNYLLICCLKLLKMKYLFVQ
uniref:Uncharacterized protein n=1 Tax=Aegilops tauschii subsp. strangulata TaxID=200361 RepID=A0A453N6K3_AEGTS